MKKRFSVASGFALALAMTGCMTGCQMPSASLPADVSMAVPETQDAPAIAVFSTYLSEPASAQCAALQTHANQCQEDAISPASFLQALQQQHKLKFAEVVPSGAGQDYELLIANQAASVITATWWQKGLHQVFNPTAPLPAEVHLFTEVTVQWRGVEIDSQLIRTRVDKDFSYQQERHAQNILSQWFELARQKQIFSTGYLYQSMQASDYQTQLSLPLQIDGFTQLDTQLYPDPFKGVISRYVHPDFEDALLDIAISPIIEPLSKTTEQLLSESLQRELKEAQMIAGVRGLELKVDQPIQQTGLNTGGKCCGLVYVLALSATQADNEPLYSTTYVFRQHDKIIKLSATFPAQMADPLVASAIPQIRVPGESPLMAGLRQLIEQQTRLN